MRYSDLGVCELTWYPWTRWKRSSSTGLAGGDGLRLGGVEDVGLGLGGGVHADLGRREVGGAADQRGHGERLRGRACGIDGE
jgi:hypothetical protein